MSTPTPKPIRSPSYPSLSLGDAVAQVRKIEHAYRFSPVDREVGAKLLGYSGLSGPANQTLAALAQFGLVERAGKGEMRVTSRARAILHPNDDSEKRQALAVAAFEPTLFRELRDRWPNMIPPEDGVVTYLNRQGFNQSAIRPATKAYLQTLSFLEEAGANESHGTEKAAGAESAVPDGDDVDGPSVVAKGGARVGDLVQWESGDSLQFEKPLRVRWVSDDGQWVAVDGSDTGIPMSEILVQERGASLAQTAPPVPPEATKALAKARTAGVGPLSMAQVENLPAAGWSQAVFPLADGPVFLNFPESMTADGYAELKEYLDIFLRRAERTKRQQEGANAEGTDADAKE